MSTDAIPAPFPTVPLRRAEAAPADRLVEEHLGLATAIARSYRDRGVELEDLEQVASLALVKAASRFDPDAGDFAPFAAATVRGEVKRYFRDRAWAVRPPRAVQELKGRMAQEPLPDRLDQGTLRRLAARHDATVEDVTAVLTSSDSFAPVPLDQHLDAERRLGDVLAAEPEGDLDGRIDLWRCLRRLPLEDRQLLQWWFFEGRTQAEIAKRLGVAQMTISRRIRKVLDGLRAELEVDPTVA